MISSVLGFIAHYKYAFIVLGAIFEGPVLSFVGGFSARFNAVNFFVFYLILIFGDLVGDSFLYSLGRFGGHHIISRFGKYIGITEKRFENAKNFFHKKGKRAIFLSKFTSGFGIAGLFTAGTLKMPFRKYITICISTSIVQYLFLMLLGFAAAHTYLKLSESLVILRYFILGLSGGILLFILVWFHRSRDKSQIDI